MKKTLAIALFLTALASAQNLTTQQRVQLSNQMTATLSNQSEGVLRAPDNRLINIFQQILRGADRHDVNYQLLVGEDNNTVTSKTVRGKRAYFLLIPGQPTACMTPRSTLSSTAINLSRGSVPVPSVRPRDDC